MTALPPDVIFMVQRIGDSRPTSEISDEWTLEELHQALANNEFTALFLNGLLCPSRPELIAAVLGGIRANTSLEILHLHTGDQYEPDIDFTDEMQIEVLQAISSLQNLKDLGWSYDADGNEVCRALGNFVASSKIKKYHNYLRLKLTDQSEEGCERFLERYETSALLLANSVRANTNLEELGISFQLSADGLAKVLDAIIVGGSVCKLTFSENGGVFVLDELPKAMLLQEHATPASCANSCLANIDFGADEEIPSEATEALCQLVKLHPQLTDITLEYQKLPNETVYFWMDWNRYGRSLLDPSVTIDSIFDTIEAVGNLPRLAPLMEKYFDEQDDDRPTLNRTSIIFQILKDVGLGRNLFE